MDLRGFASLIALTFFPLGCAQTPGATEPLHLLCETGLPRDLRDRLREHEIETVEGDSDLGVTNIYVQGSWEKAFRARDLVWQLAPERKWIVAWLSESLILPGSVEYRRMDAMGLVRERPASIRVASVEFRKCPIQALFYELTKAGIPGYVAFGYVTDYLFVPLDQASHAVRLLEGLASLPGVTIHPYVMAQY